MLHRRPISHLARSPVPQRTGPAYTEQVVLFSNRSVVAPRAAAIPLRKPFFRPGSERVNSSSLVLRLRARAPSHVYGIGPPAPSWRRSLSYLPVLIGIGNTFHQESNFRSIPQPGCSIPKAEDGGCCRLQQLPKLRWTRQPPK